MKPKPFQPWQDGPDPQCLCCYTVTPYGEWVTGIPARLLWPYHEEDDYFTDGFVCFECVEILKHHG